ncbi:hypothetical protein KAI68_06105 [bacterium]|nr:hypothetical protein [bacterium]
MIKKGLIIISCFFLFTIVCFIHPVYATGIIASFEEVTIQNLRVGQTHHTSHLANLFLVITNTGERAINLKAEVLSPAKKKLKEGYQPIPNVSWIKIIPENSIIGPGKKQAMDIVISIPDRDEYLDKKYQFNIWSYSTNEVINVGVESKFLFTTFHKKGKIKKPLNLNFTINPQEIHLEKVKVGAIIDIEKKTGKVMEIKNLGEIGSLYNIESIRVADSQVELTKGYEDCPDPSFLTFSAKKAIVGMKSSKKIKVFLSFPKKRKYRKKKYMFIARIKVFSGDVAKEVYCKIYVTTK